MSDAEDNVRLAVNASMIRMAFDAVLTLVVGVVGYVVVGVRNDLIELKAKDAAIVQDLALVKERLPIEYVRADRYLIDVVEIKAALLRIESRLNDHNDRAAKVLNGR